MYLKRIDPNTKKEEEKFDFEKSLRLQDYEKKPRNKSRKSTTKSNPRSRNVRDSSNSPPPQKSMSSRRRRVLQPRMVFGAIQSKSRVETSPYYSSATPQRLNQLKNQPQSRKNSLVSGKKYSRSRERSLNMLHIEKLHKNGYVLSKSRELARA